MVGGNFMEQLDFSIGGRSGDLSIAIVDSDNFALAYLAHRLQTSMPLATIVWTANSGNETVERCLTDPRPRIVLMGIGYSGMQGMGVCRTIRAHNDTTSLVLFAPVVTTEHRMRAAASGAQGIYAKQVETNIEHIIGRAQSGAALQDGFMSVSEAYRKLREAPIPRQFRLSPREAAALDLASRGLSMDQISEYMGVKPSTVKTFVTRASHKLGVQTVRQAIAVWTENSRFVAPQMR
ncbi:hypothetical protein GCM10007377_02770 [Galliscardovia ingluviei]|uniref:DNA-binding response regulator n=2 Tax=Galliscardovia ingluviei TaxID=1769422 RepID=A0A8J3EV79_9BIFI|nr:hypothetical protein GCM10007377_02770 [Galliscardovia ingluviei]